MVFTGRAARAAEASASEAKRLSDIEADRRHDERAPDISGKITTASGGGWYRLGIELRSDLRVDRLSIELPDKRGVWVVSTGNGKKLRSVEWTEPLKLGDAATWRIALDQEEEGKELEAVATVSAGSESWRVHVPLTVPVTPTVFFG